MSHSLVILNGAMSGTTLKLAPETVEYTIGRHSSREMQVDDDRASRLHARIVYRASHWHVEDCGSLNGTFVNSQPIQQTILEPGDLIRIGERLILFVDNSSGSSSPGIQTGMFRATTLMSRIPSEDPRGALVEQSCSESMNRAARDSAVLSRLSNLLYQHTDSKSLLRAAMDALVDGINPDAISVWLVATDGRLRCAAEWGKPGGEHILASLAVEKKKAILVESPDAVPTKGLKVAPSPVGASLSVPIPVQHGCRGAIECHRNRQRTPFARGDLDFAVVVAHQAGLALENLEHRERLELANEELRRRLSTQTRLVGTSPALQQVHEKVARVGPAGSTVLILGESGTGKELVARSIHELSRHSAGPYVAVNCAAFSESLLESELFGHEVGAFTGADRRHIGQFERAHRGTIFLDEVGEMSLACQAKLLRVLEGHSFQRLGGSDQIHVDVRVIAATHRDLYEMVRQQKFRDDLYYRLRVIDILLPPLRDRGEDVIQLASLFLEQFRSQTGYAPRRFSAECLDALRRYRWPGNVRELKNAVERAVVLGRGEEVQLADLGLLALTTEQESPDELVSLKAAERRHIEQVLRQVRGNKTQACKILGIGRATLYAKLDEDVDRDDGE